MLFSPDLRGMLLSGDKCNFLQNAQHVVKDLKEQVTHCQERKQSVEDLEVIQIVELSVGDN